MVWARARRFLATPLSTRLDEVVRDARSLFATPSRGPLVKARSRGKRSRSDGVELTVERVIRETPDAVTVVFADGHGLTWKAGQFLTLVVPTGVGPLKRAYSISSAPGGPLQVTVKRVAGGRASSWLVERLTVGQRLVVHGPSGSFVCEPVAQSSRRVLLVGGGSGITPLMAIAEALRRDEPGSVVRLVYGNRSPADTIFRERLAELGGLELRLVFESGDGPKNSPGRLDVERLAVEVGDGPWDAIYTCGPRPVMEAVLVLAEQRGWPTPRQERFESLAETKGRASKTPQPLAIRARGSVTETVVRPGQTLLEAGLQAGVAMPFSCTMGGCGACRVRLVGDVVHDEPNGLSAEERAAGHAFACIARPVGPCSVEVE